MTNSKGIHKEIYSFHKKHRRDFHPDYFKAAWFVLFTKFLPVFPSLKYQINKHINMFKGVKIHKCTESNLLYVLHDGEKLYFHEGISDKLCRFTYISLLNEQSKVSPHRYIDSEFEVDDNSIIFDVGAAEGFFALNHIERCRKVYLFECDPKWKSAIERTFAPWKEKVVLIPKYAGNKNSDTHITLDYFIEQIDKTNAFIKIDVEGAEMDVLHGADRIIKESLHAKVTACCYHNDDAEQDIQRFFKERFYSTKVNSGLMLYRESKDELKPPFFRRGVLKAYK